MKLSQLSLIAVLALLDASSAFAETKLSAGGLDIKISPQDGKYIITVNGEAAKGFQENSAFRLSNPPRLVLDLPNSHAKGNVTKKLSLDGISAVRVGSHPDKTRVVFDLTDTAEFAAKRAGNSVVLSLNAPAVVARAENKVGAVASKKSAKKVSEVASITNSNKKEKGNEEKVAVSVPASEPVQVAAVAGGEESVNTASVTSGNVSGGNVQAKEASEATEVAVNDTPVVEEQNPSLDSVAANDSNNEEVASSAAASSEGQEGALASVGGSEQVESSEPALMSMASNMSSDTTEGAEQMAMSQSAIQPSATAQSEGSTETVAAGETVVARAMVDSAQEVSAVEPAGVASVKGIYFKAIEPNGDPGVLIESEGLQSYWFSRKDGKLFEIVLENARLAGEHLKLEQFPPNKFAGFEAISAEQRGNDTVVKVFVEENSRIAPFRKDGQLWVKISN